MGRALVPDLHGGSVRLGRTADPPFLSIRTHLDLSVLFSPMEIPYSIPPKIIQR
jgi:hypothetical protein